MSKDDSLLFDVDIKSAYGYGYFSLTGIEVEKIKKVFPEGEFDVYFEGIKCSKRKIDWKGNRINLYPLRNNFHKGDKLLFKREGDIVNIIRVKKNK
jgi:hypothetical protein